ncbi:MAG: hypothetical protein ACTSPD_00060 [Promethearchaeota archaeon]
MSILLIPVAPLSKSKSRLRDCFSQELLQDLTIAMFKDLSTTLLEVNCYKEKIVYCSDKEILDLASEYNLIGIRERITLSKKTFDDIIQDLSNIAINDYKAQSTIITFIDLILISAKNFYEINALLKKNNIVICPAIHSAGISILGRHPPDIIPSCYSDPKIPSLLALYNKAKRKNLKILLYDSLRAGFDIDIKQDLIFAHEYLKIFNLTHTETYKFLAKNFRYYIEKKDENNNRTFKIIKKP